jgi:hypothetical protein
MPTSVGGPGTGNEGEEEVESDDEGKEGSDEEVVADVGLGAERTVDDEALGEDSERNSCHRFTCISISFTEATCSWVSLERRPGSRLFRGRMTLSHRE